jgi:predicted TIM-barrel fold metal-dependent hydrolase
MVKAIDVLSGHFTQANIERNFLHNEEEMGRFAQVGRARNLHSYTASEFIERLDSIGVDKILLCAILTWSFRNQRPLEQTSPEEVIEVADLYPQRIFGLYGINPMSAMHGVRRLEELVKVHRFKGIHIHPHGFGMPPDHAYYFPFYAKCQELAVPAVISMGHTLDFMPVEYGRPIHLDRIALYFPDLAVICAHTGWPWVEEAIALAWKHPNVFLATSAYAPKYWQPELVRFINSRGQDKVLWGTDYPLIDHKESLEQVRALGLKPIAEQKLLHDNAARIFGFG